MKAKFDKDHPDVYILIICPGCNQEHIFEHARWKFNGNLSKPTFSPSVRITWTTDRETPEQKDHCCHFNITDGMIAYCGDCTHGLSGQTIELPEFIEN